jgi:putative transposase
MRPSRFSKDDITQALANVRNGTPAVQECRRLGITQTTFYRWRRQHEQPSPDEVHDVRVLREENRQLKQIIADLLLDRHQQSRVPRRG